MINNDSLDLFGFGKPKQTTDPETDPEQETILNSIAPTRDDEFPPMIGRQKKNITGTTRRRRVERKKPTTTESIKISRHGAEMIQTRNPQREEQMLSRLTLPDNAKQSPMTLQERTKTAMRVISQATGIKLSENESEWPDKIGFNLSNEMQKNVLFVVLKRMTETDYKGDYQIPNETVIGRTYKNNVRGGIEQSSMKMTSGYELAKSHIGGAYQNIPNIPVLKLSVSDLIQDVVRFTGLSDTEENRWSVSQKVKDAVGHLARDMHFLMWTRIKRDNKGKLVRSKSSKKTEFEIVSTFSPVLNVNFVMDENRQSLSYYEISPSPVFLDEISRDYGSRNGGYFIMIPENFNRQIDDVYPTKRISPFVKTFCYWLRLRFTERHSQNLNVWKKNKNDYTIQIGFKELCQDLNFAESTYTTARRRTMETIRRGIDISKNIGYLLSENYDEDTDEFTFELNPGFYPQGDPNDETGQEE